MGKLKKMSEKLFSRLYRRVRAEKFAFCPDLTQRMYSCPWSLGEDLEKNCRIFVVDSRRNDVKYMERLKRDIIRCYYLYGTNTNEYFMHDMEHKRRADRETILSKKLKDDYCLKAMHGSGPFAQLKDKWSFYQLTRRFFKREVVVVDENTDRNALKYFLEKHPRFFAKPLEGTWGVGCFVGEYDPMEMNLLPEQFVSGRWIVEELIEQDERMSVWNATSINTVRINSFRQKDGSFKILYPFIRMGRRGMVVDNAGCDGVYASIDVETGRICTDGFDETGNRFVQHPDVRVTFMNWQIPCWEDCIAYAKKVHAAMPLEHIYIGFDMALSTKGWMIVEGNWGDFICQQSSLRRGLKKEFKEAIEG